MATRAESQMYDGPLDIGKFNSHDLNQIRAFGEKGTKRALRLMLMPGLCSIRQADSEQFVSSPAQLQEVLRQMHQAIQSEMQRSEYGVIRTVRQLSPKTLQNWHALARATMLDITNHSLKLQEKLGQDTLITQPEIMAEIQTEQSKKSPPDVILKITGFRQAGLRGRSDYRLPHAVTVDLGGDPKVTGAYNVVANPQPQSRKFYRHKYEDVFNGNLPKRLLSKALRETCGIKAINLPKTHELKFGLVIAEQMDQNQLYQIASDLDYNPEVSITLGFEDPHKISWLVLNRMVGNLPREEDWGNYFTAA